MNFREVFFFGQYGQHDRFKVCAWDHHGVWRRLDGSYMPQPKLIEGALVCAPGDLIERLGSSAVAERIEAVRQGREQTKDGGSQAACEPLPRLSAGAENNPENESSPDVRNASNGMRTWAKQWGSKRWHALKIETGGEDSEKSLCGRRILATRKGPIPSWHVACSACLHVIEKRRKKCNPYNKPPTKRKNP